MIKIRDYGGMVVAGLLILAAEISSIVENPSLLSGNSAEEQGYASGVILILILGAYLVIKGIREIRRKQTKGN